MRKIVLSTAIISIACNNSAGQEKTEVETINNLTAKVSIETKTKPTISSNCPSKMVEVNGNYCKNLQHKCLKHIDPEGSIVRRCAEFDSSPKCIGKEKQLHFCIDKYEYSAQENDLPLTEVSWAEAQSICSAEGKRLCYEYEWTLACEGPQKLAHPYGWKRDSSLCHIDNEDLLDHGTMIDKRKSVMSFPKCISPFGVQNMTGNVGEMTHNLNEKSPLRFAGKGGWWGPLRSNCRAITGGHNEYFKQIQIGFRCCKEIEL